MRERERERKREREKDVKKRVAAGLTGSEGCGWEGCGREGDTGLIAMDVCDRTCV
jgi:hypothetical protein